MLINLSNHPSSLWSAAQIEAARQYGVIEDMSFPVIDPAMSHDEILQCAHEYAEQIMAKARKCNITVHVMGEMNFVYALVEELKNDGITCVASTTIRNVTEEANGMKTSTFNFVQFREY